MARRRFVALGDSWAFDHFSFLEARWTADYPDAPTTLNYGRGSTTYQNWLNAWDTEQSHSGGPFGPLETEIHPGDFIYMSLGGNDEVNHLLLPTDPTYGHDAQSERRKTLIDLLLTIDDVLIIVPSYFFFIYGSPIAHTDRVHLQHAGTYPRNTVSGERPVPREIFPVTYGDRVEYMTQLSANVPEQSMDGGDGLHLSDGRAERCDYVQANSIFWRHRSEF